MIEKKPRKPRKLFAIDYDLVAKLATIHCTVEEIAFFLGCHKSTLERRDRFKKVYHDNLGKGKISLRRRMWEAALAGNTAMMIFLAKNTIGMKDNPDENNFETPVPIQITYSIREEAPAPTDNAEHPAVRTAI